MSKNYRNKEATIAEAKRLGIDVSGMSWPDMQRAVKEGLERERLGVSGKPAKPVELSEGEKRLRPYIGKTVMISPELAPERYRLLKYDEDLGSDIEVEERHFDMDDNDRVFDRAGGKVDYGNVVDQYHDYTTGTYRIGKRSNRRVIAMSSVPKENSGMIFRPGIDLVPVVTWKGRMGYLWTHQRLPNIKNLLIECGKYQKYKDRFKDEPAIWYAAGKQLVCDPQLVHAIFAEIEEEAQKNLEEDRARRRALGLE